MCFFASNGLLPMCLDWWFAFSKKIYIYVSKNMFCGDVECSLSYSEAEGGVSSIVFIPRCGSEFSQV